MGLATSSSPKGFENLSPKKGSKSLCEKVSRVQHNPLSVAWTYHVIYALLWVKYCKCNKGYMAFYLSDLLSVYIIGYVENFFSDSEKYQHGLGQLNWRYLHPLFAIHILKKTRWIHVKIGHPRSHTSWSKSFGISLLGDLKEQWQTHIY